jgi:hypothetical protein
VNDSERPGIGRKLYNFVAFQVGWFACVLGAAAGHSWMGPSVVVVLLAIHLWIARHRRGEALFLLSSIPLGIAVNFALQTSGAVVASGPAIGPLWLLALWPLFATLFNESMVWMRGRYGLGVLFGTVGAPFSYWAGERAGALEFQMQTTAWIAVVAVAWSLAMCALLALQLRLTPIKA